MGTLVVKYGASQARVNRPSSETTIGQLVENVREQLGIPKNLVPKLVIKAGGVAVASDTVVPEKVQTITLVKAGATKG